MRIAVASMAETLDSHVSGIFGRCSFFLIVDSESLSCEVLANAAQARSGGAGSAAVEGLAERGVQAVLAGHFGSKAQKALDAAGIRGVCCTGAIRDALAKVTS